MYKRWNIILPYLFLCPLGAWGQAMDASSGETALQEVEALLDAARLREADSLLTVLSPSLRQLQDPQLEAQRLHLAGYIALEQGQYGQALSIFQQAVLQTTADFGPKDAQPGQAHNDLGHYFFTTGQPDSAWYHHQIALSIRLEKFGPVHEKVADSYNNLGNVLQVSGRSQEALPLYEKVLAIRQQTPGVEPTAIASVLNNIGNAYLSLGQLTQATRTFRQVLRIRSQALGVAHPLYGRSLQNLGNAFYQSGQLDSADQYFQGALDNARLHYDTTHPRLADLYENLGNCAIAQDQVAAAGDWYQKALNIREARASVDPVAPASTYLYLGDVYRKSGNFLEALRLSEKGWSILVQYLPENDLYLADAWEKMGLCHMALGHYREARENFKVTLEIRQRALGAQHPLVAGTYSNLGNVYWLQSAYQAAILNYQQALNIWETSGGNHTRERAETYSNIGNAYLKAEALPEALAAYRKAQELAGTYSTLLSATIWQQTGLVYDGLQQYPQALDAYRRSLAAFDQAAMTGGNSRRGVLFTHSAQANTLLHIYQQGGQRDTLQLAATAFGESLELLSQQQLNLSAIESRQKAIALHYDLFAGAIDCQLALWEAEQDSAHLWRAFQLSEESKGLLLREKWQDEASASSPGSTTGAGVLDRTLHTDAGVAADLQARLQGQRGLLAFSYGPRQLFWFFLKDGRLQAGKIDHIQQINRLIANLNEVITQFPLAPSQKKADLDSLYQSYALDLYRLIWAQLEPHISGTTEFVIVPDGTLAYLPFAALLTDKPERAMRYRSYPYLLHRYQISYAYSTALLAKAIHQSRKKRKFSCLAFAPTFEGHTPPLLPLQFNASEVNGLKKAIGADAYTGDAATLANFLKMAPHYQVLHLATHGVTNSSRSEFSYLAFSIPEPGVNGHLYVQDLYETHLSADMVVMSACESGLGLFQAGEGAISLGYGFVAAGARSIISTLWSVNDAKTADFMQVFYQKLQEGMTKDAAIRAVQEAYLEDATQEDAHPFYWAAYLPVGDMAPLDIRRNGALKWIALSGLLLFGWLFYRRKKGLLKNISK